jgi:hypothetical protein
MRVDGLPALSQSERGNALKAAMDFLTDKYHIRNFAYQWIEGQSEEIKSVLEELGFKKAARFRRAWRTGNTDFADVEQYHWLSAQSKPVARRLGDDDQLGQNIDSSPSGEVK